MPWAIVLCGGFHTSTRPAWLCSHIEAHNVFGHNETMRDATDEHTELDRSLARPHILAQCRLKPAATSLAVMLDFALHDLLCVCEEIFIFDTAGTVSTMAFDDAPQRGPIQGWQRIELLL